jgi:hypothetical protein
LALAPQSAQWCSVDQPQLHSAQELGNRVEYLDHRGISGNACGFENKLAFLLLGFKKKISLFDTGKREKMIDAIKNCPEKLLERRSDPCKNGVEKCQKGPTKLL